MAATSNVQQVVIAMQAQGEGLERALVDELARQAQMAVRFMKQRAPKRYTTLTHSIHTEKVSDVEWLIRPGVDYARAVEEGVKPGGKGLPRWSDPEAADMKRWLAAKAFGGLKRVRSKLLREALRDRYEGMAWHVRHFGTKAQPYVAPTAEMMRAQFPDRMQKAAQQYLAGLGGGRTA